MGGARWARVTASVLVAGTLVAAAAPASALSVGPAPAPAVTSAVGDPEAPGGVTAVAGDGRAQVYWVAAPGGAAATSWRVVGQPVSGGDTPAVVTVGAAERRAVVAGLTNGRTYRFRVTALAGAVAGPASSTSPLVVPTRWAPFDSAASFVAKAYEQFAGRTPTAAERTQWVAALQNGSKGGSELVAQLATAPYWGGIGEPLTRLYAAYYLRIPDTGGLGYWIGKRRTGTSLSAVSGAFASASEFRTRYGSLSNRDFVLLIYTNVLQRSPDAGGVNYWTAKLDGGMTRGAVMIGFSESGEYQRRSAPQVRASMFHLGLLGDAPTQAELDTWSPQLAQGSSPLDYLGWLLTGPTYPGRVRNLAPSAPAGVSALAGDGRASVSWQAPALPGTSSVTGYEVVVSPGGARRTAPASTRTLEVSGLPNGTAHTFTVTASSAAGTGLASDPSAPVTPTAPATVPGIPGTPTGAAGDGQVSLSWTAPASTGGSAITGYVITPYAGSTALSSVTTTGTSTSRVVTGLTNGTAHTFRVAARNSVGTGSASAASVALTPTAPASTTAAKVAAGPATSCRLAPNGRVACWGTGYWGDLGTNTVEASNRPIVVDGLAGVVGIDANDSYACAVLASGQVSCWGFSYDGRTGVGGPTFQTLATPVAGITGAVEVATGGSHACALVAGGTVRCWGANGQGQLGNGSTGAGGPTPVTVTGIAGATAIAAGRDQTCAVVANGAVRCWGANWAGQLGNGTTSQTPVATPVAVSGLTGVTALAGGFDRTCALVAGGQARCWGNNGEGGLGNGTTTSSNVPVTVSGITGATALSLGRASGGDVIDGGAHGCVVVAGGQIRCWGSGTLGELGNGTTTSSSSPVVVSGSTGAVDVAAGASHTCAVKADGSSMCWGRNEAGQLGNGATGEFGDAVTTPVAVVTGGPLIVASSSLPDASVASSYVATLSATGGAAPVTWSATGLPAGLSVAAGRIVGTPTVTGTSSVVIRAQDAGGAVVTRTLALRTWAEAGKPVIRSTSLPAATERTPYRATLLGDVPRGAYWQADGAPAWFSIDEDGVVTATPSPGSAGTYPVTIRLVDPEAEVTATEQLTLAVATVPTISASAMVVPAFGSRSLSGRFMVIETAAESGVFELYDRTTGTRVALPIPKLSGAVTYIDGVSDDGQRVLWSTPSAAEAQRGVYLLDRSTGTNLRISSTPRSDLNSVLANTGRYAAFAEGTPAQTLVVHDVQAGTRTTVANLCGEGLKIQSVIHVATDGSSVSVSCWSIEPGLGKGLLWRRGAAPIDYEWAAPTLSPNGRWGVGESGVVDLVTGSVTPIGSPLWTHPFSGEIAISDDGRFIVFAGLLDLEGDPYQTGSAVMVLDRTTGVTRRFGTGTTSHFQPVVSSDARTISYFQFEEGFGVKTTFLTW